MQNIRLNVRVLLRTVGYQRPGIKNKKHQSFVFAQRDFPRQAGNSIYGSSDRIGRQTRIAGVTP